MKLSSVWLFLMIGLSVASCTQAQQREGSPKVINLGPAEFVQQIKSIEHPQLLDVRSLTEWEEGKIASSHCVSHNDPAFATAVDKLDKNKPVFVYCRSGGRSPIAAKALIDLGFLQVYNLQGGGFEDLERAGIQ
jgi:rhodanese-related sulfurtransferase